MVRQSLAVLDRLAIKPTCTIGGAYEGTAHDTSEADCGCLVGKLDEFLGLDPALHRMMARRRAEVLRDRDNLDSGVVQVLEGFTDLRTGLAHSKNEIGLGDQSGHPRRSQYIQGTLVAEARTNPLEDPRDRLHVMCENLRLGFEDLMQVLRIAGEVGCQHLNPGIGVDLVTLPDGFGLEPRTLIWKIIRTYTSDSGIAKTHLAYRISDPKGFGCVECGGLAGVNLAKIAAPGADIASDEERGFAVFPALEDVGASRLLA